MVITTLFFLTNRQMLVYLRQGSAVELHARFDDSPEGQANFEQWLAGQPRVVSQLLVDLGDEDFHFDRIPRVSGRDRNALLKRKFEQLYRNTPYRTSQSQGHDKEGRRDERMLFSALPSAGWLEQWLNLIEQHKVPLAGIASLALMAKNVVQHLGFKDERLSLISYHPDSGLRQTFVDAQGVKLSRLIPLDAAELDDLGNRILAESRRALQYLASLRLITRDDKLDVVMLLPLAQQQAVSAICVSQEQLRFSFVEPATVLAKFGIKGPADCDAQYMYALMALQQAPFNNYAPPSRRWYYHLWRLRRGLMAATVVSVVVATIGFWWLSNAIDQQKREENQKRQQIVQTQKDYLAKQIVIDHFKVSSQEMDGVVSLYRQQIKPWPQVIPTLQALSGLLNQHPTLKVSSLGWLVSQTESENPFDSNELATAAPEAAVIPAEGEAALVGPQYLVIGLAGRVEPFTENYREILAQLERFKQAVESSKKARLEWDKLPLDIRPNATIDLKLAAETANFRGRIILSIKPATPASAATAEVAQ